MLKKIANLYGRIKQTAPTDEMDGHQKQKLSIFNQINFFGLLTGISISVAAFFGEGYLPVLS